MYDLFGNVFSTFGNTSVSRYSRIDYSKNHWDDSIIVSKKFMKSFLEITSLLSLLHPRPSFKDSDNLSSLSFG